MARVIVTRPAGQDDELAARIEALGHDVVRCPLIAIEPLGDAPVDVDGYDWVIVTSVNGARELRRRMRGSPARVAAIGRATAAAFGGADLVPSVSTQEGLLAELPRPAGRVLFAAAQGARPLLADELGADFLPLYRTRELRPDAFPEGDLVVLTSASAARAYAALGVGTQAVTIGPQTTRAADDAGVSVLVEAPSHDLDGLVEAVAAAASVRGVLVEARGASLTAFDELEALTDAVLADPRVSSATVFGGAVDARPRWRRPLRSPESPRASIALDVVAPSADEARAAAETVVRERLAAAGLPADAVAVSVWHYAAQRYEDEPSD